MSDGLPDEDSVAVLENDSVPNVSVSVGDWEVEKVSDGVSVDDRLTDAEGEVVTELDGENERETEPEVDGVADAEAVADSERLALSDRL